ncbi:hypothetical protein [Pseudoalteromonas rubra]|uniref:hypothetical protein n=1 Tax=Pseudoalteromonas rubra TaxID=43658 RepID=UPI000F76AACA|nr:hypothetical protein [Pseudoalteromonas rubra]
MARQEYAPTQSKANKSKQKSLSFILKRIKTNKITLSKRYKVGLIKFLAIEKMREVSGDKSDVMAFAIAKALANRKVT